MSKNQGKRLKHLPYLKLKGLLAEMDLTQKCLAELLGLSPATINQKINGSLEFTYTEVENICDKLNVSTEVLRCKKSYIIVTIMKKVR
ncbi:MAG TPA: helix-turn-helix transcriptional regulator [Desulfosporosinus sp.]|nr:helix-turn-helix transcriptional regulator [Desulfosporosinus sp.]